MPAMVFFDKDRDAIILAEPGRFSVSENHVVAITANSDNTLFAKYHPSQDQTPFLQVEIRDASMRAEGLWKGI